MLTANEVKVENKLIVIKPQEDFGLIGCSQFIQSVISKIKKVAIYDQPVLITGETGTGKDVVANAIVEAGRKRKKLVKVNCGAIPASLFQSEILGASPGAYTGITRMRKGYVREASGGILFLDEIGDLSKQVQAALLRVVDNKEVSPLGSDETENVDIKIISATNKNLEEMIKNGEFREDLYERLRVTHIHLLPLRQRKEDIPVLIDYFFNYIEKKYSIEKGAFGDYGIDQFKERAMNYNWPNNIRELKNQVENSLICGTIDIPQKNKLVTFNGEDYSLKTAEKNAIVRALVAVKGIQKDAAQLLGISRRAVCYKIERHKIDIKKLKTKI